MESEKALELFNQQTTKRAHCALLRMETGLGGGDLQGICGTGGVNKGRKTRLARAGAK